MRARAEAAESSPAGPRVVRPVQGSAKPAVEGPAGPATAAGLVVGLGSDRGDDAVGPLVARAVRSRCLPGVHVVEVEDPTRLLDVWDGHDRVVVVDAVRSGGAPGAVHRLMTGDALPPLPGHAWARVSSTHGFGLAGAVELARALHRLPRRLVVVGVEAAEFEEGAGLSPEVSAAVQPAVEVTVAAVLGGAPDVPALARHPVVEDEEAADVPG